jgi:hypothetical protein
LKKPLRPLKRKDFMKIFFDRHVDDAGAGFVSNRCADSDPCVRNAKAAALFDARKGNSPGIQFSWTAVARKLRHAITWFVRSARGYRSSAD